MFNKVTYRKIEGFGWYIIGVRVAQRLGLKNYASPSAVCKSGHTSPFSVHRKKCVRCITINARNRGNDRSNEETFEYWRKRLKLPMVKDTSNVRYVYIVENMPYPKLNDAVQMTKIPLNVIYRRCQQEAWPTYQMIPTQFKLRQVHAYYCEGNEYHSLPGAAKGQKISTQQVMFNIQNKTMSNWYRVKIM